MSTYIDRLRSQYSALQDPRVSDEQILRLLPRLEPERFGGMAPEQVSAAALNDDWRSRADSRPESISSRDLVAGFWLSREMRPDQTSFATRGSISMSVINRKPRSMADRSSSR
jgi:hypothetical protein